MFAPARRTVLTGIATLALARTGAAATLPTLPLWPDEPPGGGGPTGAVVVDGGSWRNIARPSLTAVTPTRPGVAAVLIAAGGGYHRIAMESEAMPAAHWLAERGITAFVLAYRLPSEGWSAGALAPLQDAQRALRLIRAGVAGLPAPSRVGVLGFSAGGHLMGMSATAADRTTYAPVDAADRASARPDAAALIYPVITLEPPYQHTATRRMLIGPHPDAQASADWSVQTHVQAGCPPVFLVQAADDPTVDPANFRIMVEACEKAGVPIESHLLPSGGHGFGMGRPGTPTALWPTGYAAWLARQGLMPA